MRKTDNGLLICATHPVQYRAPLLKVIAEQVDIDVVYYTKHGLTDRTVEGMGELPKWDVPLLDGYRSSFSRNYSPVPNVSRFWGTINPGIIGHVARSKHRNVWIFGWNSVTNLLVILTATLLRKRVWMLAESPWNQEVRKTGSKQRFKRWLLTKILFRIVDRFLYIGEQNRRFYLQHGVTDERLVYAPYCVDNQRLQSSRTAAAAKRDAVRDGLGVSSDTLVVLFVGKLISKKCPMDLLDAFQGVCHEDSQLWFVGSGPLESQLRARTAELGLAGRVQFLGYRNQQELPELFAASDMFVLPSTDGETWGLVVNEAMNFGLPVVVSDRVGCADNLVKDNGYLFPVHDVERLTEALSKMLQASPQDRLRMGENSVAIVNDHSYEVVVENLVKALQYE